MIYRVLNRGATLWRPWINEIRVYTDPDCTLETNATFVDMSGYLNTIQYGDGAATVAFDNSEDTVWRPQCHSCDIEEAWVSFSVSEEIKCVQALDWDDYAKIGGIKVEIQNSDNTWTTMMESSHENIVYEILSLEGKSVYLIHLTCHSRITH